MTDYTESAERFARDTRNHQMTVLHDDGLYRHVRFATEQGSFYWFELVTWPGRLAFAGSLGAAYVFARHDDMFAFFRGGSRYNASRINPGYWAEKLPDAGRSVRVYDEDVLTAQVGEALAEYESAYPEIVTKYEADKVTFEALPQDARYPYDYRGMRQPVEPKTLDELRQLQADYDADGLLAYEDGARRFLAELEDANVVLDTGEWDLKDWHWTFLWACHAIVWGIAQYDAVKAAKPAEAVASHG